MPNGDCTGPPWGRRGKGRRRMGSRWYGGILDFFQGRRDAYSPGYDGSYGYTPRGWGMRRGQGSGWGRGNGRGRRGKGKW